MRAEAAVEEPLWGVGVLWSRLTSVTQLCELFVIPWTAAHQASLSITNSQSLLKLMSIESVIPSNHLIFCRPLLLLPSILPSIRVFSNEPVPCIRWPKYWSFSISPSNEYSRLISFSIDWFDLFSFLQTASICYSHTSVHMKYFIIAATRVRLCGPQRPRCDSAAS